MGFGTACILEFSGGFDKKTKQKKYHVWIILADGTECSKARKFGLSILSELGYTEKIGFEMYKVPGIDGTIELFPKHDAVYTKEKPVWTKSKPPKKLRYGSVVRLPLGINRKEGGKRSCFVDPDTLAELNPNAVLNNIQKATIPDVKAPTINEVKEDVNGENEATKFQYLLNRLDDEKRHKESFNTTKFERILNKNYLCIRYACYNVLDFQLSKIATLEEAIKFRKYAIHNLYLTDKSSSNDLFEWLASQGNFDIAKSKGGIDTVKNAIALIQDKIKGKDVEKYKCGTIGKNCKFLTKIGLCNKCKSIRYIDDKIAHGMSKYEAMKRVYIDDLRRLLNDDKIKQNNLSKNDKFIEIEVHKMREILEEYAWDYEEYKQVWRDYGLTKPNGRNLDYPKGDIRVIKFIMDKVKRFLKS